MMEGTVHMGFRRIRVRDVYNIDKISQRKSWVTLTEKLSEELKSGDELLLDFDDIIVEDPLKHQEFKEILSLPHVRMKFSGKDKSKMSELIAQVKIACVAEGLPINKAEFELIEVKRERTRQEIEAEKRGKDMLGRFKVMTEEKKAILELDKLYSSLCTSKTMDSIAYSIEELMKDGITNFDIETGDMYIQKNILEAFAKMSVKLEDDGVTFSLLTTRPENFDNYGLFVHQFKDKRYTAVERVKEFCKLPKNRAGLLIMYRRSRATDEFGRSGKGEIAYNRISIFKGICLRGIYSSNIKFLDIEVTDKNVIKDSSGRVYRADELQLVFDTYSNKEFMTKVQWAVGNDGEVPEELPYKREKIDITSVGLDDLFMARYYHFLKPIQKDPSENIDIIMGMDEEGGIIRQNVSTPERISIVTEDWDIDVDAGELSASIESTLRDLNMTA